MIVVKDRRTGQTHSGRSPETIARRLYGKRAYVWYSADRNQRWQAYACTPAHRQPNVANIEAEWYLDDAALAAREDAEDTQ